MDAGDERIRFADDDRRGKDFLAGEARDDWHLIGGSDVVARRKIRRRETHRFVQAIRVAAGDWFDRTLDEVFADKRSTVGEPKKSAGIRTDRVINETTAALTALFDGKRAVSSDAAFDEELNAKAKPLFKTVFDHLRDQEAAETADSDSILRTIEMAQRPGEGASRRRK